MLSDPTHCSIHRFPNLNKYINVLFQVNKTLSRQEKKQSSPRSLMFAYVMTEGSVLIPMTACSCCFWVTLGYSDESSCSNHQTPCSSSETQCLVLVSVTKKFKIYIHIYTHIYAYIHIHTYIKMYIYV